MLDVPQPLRPGHRFPSQPVHGHAALHRPIQAEGLVLYNVRVVDWIDCLNGDYPPMP